MANEHQDIFDALGLAPTDSSAMPHPEQVLSGIGEGLGVNDLLRAVRSGRPENMLYAGGMLGINALMPGARAEKAAAAAAPLMKDLFPQSSMLGKIGHMTPSEYVASYGDASQFAKTFPESFKVIEPHLSEDQKLEHTMGQIKDALGVVMDEPEGMTPREMINAGIPTTQENLAKYGKPNMFTAAGVEAKPGALQDFMAKKKYISTSEYMAAQPNAAKPDAPESFDPGLLKSLQNALQPPKPVTQADIDKALAKNPGASIADIAGVGPKTSWQANLNNELAYKNANLLMPSHFPTQVPFGVPEHAQPLGFSQPAVHGTPDRWGWKGPMDQLMLPEKQIGVHFGDPGQAAHFSVPGGDYMSSNYTYAAARPRTYPVVLQMQNPLELRDMGSWGIGEMKDALRQINDGTHQSYAGGTRPVSTEHKGLFPQKELDQLEDIQDVRNYLADKGFDSIKYTNSVEGPGRPSYIMFQGSPVDSRYVAGVRSPFAKFDPKNLHLPSLTASGAGLLAYPLLSRNGDGSQ